MRRLLRAIAAGLDPVGNTTALGALDVLARPRASNEVCPRPAGTTREVELAVGWIVVLLGLAAFVGAGVVVAMARSRQMRMLVERGVAVTGTVVGRFQTGRAGKTERTKRIAFTYRGPDGREYRRAASMTRARWEQYEEGAPIELICLPDDPGVSAEAWLVERAREAIAKTRTRS